MSWYIDAWSVFDGINFASETNNRADQPHERTVFIAPPYWRPLALTNPATALRATRGPFQDRLFFQGGEVEFDSLDEIIEITRRAFILGGWDTFNPPAGETPIPLVPEGQGGPGEAWTEVEEKLAEVVTREDVHSLAYALRTSLDDAPQLRNLTWQCREYAIAAAESLSYATERQQQVDWRRWMQMMLVIFGPEAIQEFYHRNHKRLGLPHRQFYWFVDRNESIGSLADHLLLQLPVRRPDGSRGVMADLLALTFSSRDFLRHHGHWQAFFPVLFAGIVLARATQVTFNLEEITADDIGAAADWIADSVPRTIKDHAAEHVLEKLVKRVQNEGRAAILKEATEQHFEPPPPPRFTPAPQQKRQMRYRTSSS